MRNSTASAGLVEGEIEIEDKVNLVGSNVSIELGEELVRIEQCLEGKEANRHIITEEQDSSPEQFSNLASSSNVVNQDGSDDDDVLTNRSVRNRLRKASEKAIPMPKEERNEKEGPSTLKRTPHTRGHKRKAEKELQKAIITTKRSRVPRGKATTPPSESMMEPADETIVEALIEKERIRKGKAVVTSKSVTMKKHVQKPISTKKRPLSRLMDEKTEAIYFIYMIRTSSL
ncbi:hypothetical protein K7X08_037232 [Anisodus acutangulus]|uniref:Uncharacterized protein n=1 Tax=Anisodus acutangulus TaxID=402998 RepID=A0A9Q1MXA6_9SOLA|nr:hypothetical protein K7X08_037232 [Anisodus acutangulus]